MIEIPRNHAIRPLHFDVVSIIEGQKTSRASISAVIEKIVPDTGWDVYQKWCSS